MMKNSILNHLSRNDYFIYLDSLDSGALLNEFYALHHLKRAITTRLDRVCRIVYNQYCTLLADINHENITSYEHYLFRILLRFEVFVKRQQQYINELHDLYDPKPIRTIESPEGFNVCSVLLVYDDVMYEMRRLETIVSSFEEKLNTWMHFLYNMRDIPEIFKKEQFRKNNCAVNPDGSYDFRYQFELTYKELVSIVETVMDCDITVFKDKRNRI